MSDTQIKSDGSDAKFRRAYFDLEDRIRNLAHMAEIARFYAVESSGSNETKESKHEGELAVFAVRQCEQMVRDLVKAYDAGFESSRTGPA
jgi:hypothetical protein